MSVDLSPVHSEQTSVVCTSTQDLRAVYMHTQTECVKVHCINSLTQSITSIFTKARIRVVKPHGPNSLLVETTFCDLFHNESRLILHMISMVQFHRNQT